MRNIIWTIFFVSFILDVLKIKFIEKDSEININEPQTEEYSKKNINPHNVVNSDSLQNEELNLELDPEVDRKQDRNENQDYNSEKSEKVILNVKYCTTSYAKQFEQFKKDLIGNYTNIEVLGQEYPINPTRKMLGKFFWYFQMGMMIIIIGGQGIRGYLTFIPARVFEFLDKNKFIVGLFNFLGIGWIMNQLNSTFAFEVIAQGEIIWSKLETNLLPITSTIVDILKSKGYNLE